MQTTECFRSDDMKTNKTEACIVYNAQFLRSKLKTIAICLKVYRMLIQTLNVL